MEGGEKASKPKTLNPKRLNPENFGAGVFGPTTAPQHVPSSLETRWSVLGQIDYPFGVPRGILGVGSKKP